MTQYEETTKAKAETYENEVYVENFASGGEAFTAGRDSAKPSLEILARALEDADRALSPIKFGSVKDDGTRKRVVDAHFVIETAIAEVKARGDWPL